MFYSAQTNGFYLTEVHGVNMPPDVVAITPAEHAALLAGQATGQRIVADLNGLPVLADRPATPNPPKQFTSLEFLDLFTEAEQLAIVQAGMASAPVKLWYDRALAAQFVTIADPRTAGGLAALVTAGLLTEARRASIVEAMQ